MTDAKLQSRVWRAIELSADPSALAVALHTFLPRCTMSVRDDVPTARISRSGDHIDLEFGHAFLRDDLADDRDFLFVLLHEVYHHVLGHLVIRPGDELSRRCPEAANLAADMLVNRALIDRYFPLGVPLLSRLYGNGVPACLLKPVDKCLKGAGRKGRPSPDRFSFIKNVEAAGCTREIARKAWGVHRLGWQQQPSYEQLLEHVVDLLDSAGMLRQVSVLFLGNHDGPCDCEIPWPVPGEEGGSGQDIDESEVQMRDTQGDRNLAVALRRALETDPARRSMQIVPMSGVICSPGRSDLAFLAAGMPVTIYHGARPATDEGMGAHVYLDVSGSMEEELPGLFYVLNSIVDLVVVPLHQFSNVVVDCTMDDLARGTVRTTGGTSFGPVLEHALDRRYRQIVVVSDGGVSSPGSVEDRFAQSGASLHLVLVGGGRHRMYRNSSPMVRLSRTVTYFGRGA